MRTLALAVICALVSGCARHNVPVVEPQPLPPTAKRFQAVWRASREVLRDYRFEIERSDPRAGLLVTRPMVSRYFWEFWREEAKTPRAVAEASLHTVYRAAMVEVEAADEAFVANSTVLVGRSNRPPPQLNDAAQVAMVYSGSAESLDFGSREADADPDWEPRRDAPLSSGPMEVRRQLGIPHVTPLGRDVNLEARINARIAERAEQILRDMP